MSGEVIQGDGSNVSAVRGLRCLSCNLLLWCLLFKTAVTHPSLPPPPPPPPGSWSCSLALWLLPDARTVTSLGSAIPGQHTYCFTSLSNQTGTPYHTPDHKDSHNGYFQPTFTLVLFDLFKVVSCIGQNLYEWYSIVLILEDDKVICWNWEIRCANFAHIDHFW